MQRIKQLFGASPTSQAKNKDFEGQRIAINTSGGILHGTVRKKCDDLPERWNIEWDVGTKEAMAAPAVTAGMELFHKGQHAPISSAKGGAGKASANGSASTTSSASSAAAPNPHGRLMHSPNRSKGGSTSGGAGTTGASSAAAPSPQGRLMHSPSRSKGSSTSGGGGPTPPPPPPPPPRSSRGMTSPVKAKGTPKSPDPSYPKCMYIFSHLNTPAGAAAHAGSPGAGSGPGSQSKTTPRGAKAAAAAAASGGDKGKKKVGAALPAGKGKPKATAPAASGEKRRASSAAGAPAGASPPLAKKAKQKAAASGKGGGKGGGGGKGKKEAAKPLKGAPDEPEGSMADHGKLVAKVWNSRFFIGRVTSVFGKPVGGDYSSMLWRIKYEDDDIEDLDMQEVQGAMTAYTNILRACATSKGKLVPPAGRSPSRRGALTAAPAPYCGPEDVGRRVAKNFGETGTFLGQVTAYYPSEGASSMELWHIRYEDDDEEDLDKDELEVALQLYTKDYGAITRKDVPVPGLRPGSMAPVYETRAGDHGLRVFGTLLACTAHVEASATVQ